MYLMQVTPIYINQYPQTLCRMNYKQFEHSSFRLLRNIISMNILFYSNAQVDLDIKVQKTNFCSRTIFFG